MGNRKNSVVVEDIWINTQVTGEEMDDANDADPEVPASWNEIEEDNTLLNPDDISMDYRG